MTDTSKVVFALETALKEGLKLKETWCSKFYELMFIYANNGKKINENKNFCTIKLLWNVFFDLLRGDPYVPFWKWLDEYMTEFSEMLCFLTFLRL